VDRDVVIDPSKAIEPRQLCERGGETIVAPLNARCRKKGEMLCNNYNF
jgi:hypothetical protein